MVEIKITGETAEKAHNELKDLATLIFGNRKEPVKPEPKPEKQEQTVEAKEEEPTVEVTPVVSTPTAKPTRTRSSNRSKQTEESKPEEKPVEVAPVTPPAEETAPVEETKATEESKPEVEDKPTEEASGSAFPAPFDDCATETEVVNKVRSRIADLMKDPKTEPAARAIFLEYKVPTVLKLTLEQKMDFFNKVAHL